MTRHRLARDRRRSSLGILVSIDARTSAGHIVTAQAVRREGHRSTSSVRPDAVVVRRGRDRVRRQGDPARRLRQDRRDDRPQERRSPSRRDRAARLLTASPALAARRSTLSRRLVHAPRCIGARDPVLRAPFVRCFGGIVPTTERRRSAAVVAVRARRQVDRRPPMQPAARPGRRRPARPRGLQPGDRIVAVDGTPVTHLGRRSPTAIRAQPARPDVTWSSSATAASCTDHRAHRVARSGPTCDDPDETVTGRRPRHRAAAETGRARTARSSRSARRSSQVGSLLGAQRQRGRAAARARSPAAVGRAVRRPAARPERRRSAWSASAGSAATSRQSDLPPAGKVGTLLMLLAGLQPLPRRVQPAPAAAAGRRPHRRSLGTSGSARWLRPAARAGPTRAAVDVAQAAAGRLRRDPAVRDGDGAAARRRHRQPDPALG